MFESLNKGISTTRGVLVIVLIAAIAGGGILAYQYLWQPEPIEPPIQPPTDETADWQTYRNEEYGFEIKYPKEIVIEESSYGIKFLSPEDLKLKHLPHSPYFMFIHTEINSKENLESWIQSKFWLKDFKEFKGDPTAETNYVDLIEVLLISENIKGYKIHRWIQASDECLYYFRGENTIIEISRLNQGIPSNPYPSCSEDFIFEEILSTFKFIEKQPESIQVLSPNGGETWQDGNEYLIKWSNSSEIKTVRILLFAAEDENSVLEPVVPADIETFLISQKEYAPRGYMRWTIDSKKLGLDFSRDKYFAILIEGYSVAPEQMPEVGWGKYLVASDHSDKSFSIIGE